MGLHAPDSGQTAAAPREPSRMLIFADLKIGTQQFYSVLSSLGEHVSVGPGVWALRSVESIAVVRNRLAAETLPQDRLLIADISCDRFAGVNLGPEVESRLRQVWRATREHHLLREGPRSAR